MCSFIFSQVQHNWNMGLIKQKAPVSLFGLYLLSNKHLWGCTIDVWELSTNPTENGACSPTICSVSWAGTSRLTEVLSWARVQWFQWTIRLTGKVTHPFSQSNTSTSLKKSYKRHYTRPLIQGQVQSCCSGPLWMHCSTDMNVYKETAHTFTACAQPEAGYVFM